MRPRAIMKRKLLVSMLLIALLLALACVASAETDPIVCSMEVSPSTLTAPGPVTVTINISNSGNTDMKDPVVLYNPISQVVEDFGTKGAVMLKAGESQTWTGTWDVNKNELAIGTIVYFVKYTLYKDSGEGYSQSQPIRGKLSSQAATGGIEIKRTISPGTAREKQTVTVKYDIVNTGTVSLTNIVVQENKDINKSPQKVAELKPGDSAQVKFPLTMGKKDLVSSATITYQTAGSSKKETKEIEKATIIYGEPAMNAKLTSSATGVAINGKLTLTLELSNNGNVDYSDLRVTDSTLGEVFSNQSLASKGSLKLEKEITLSKTTDYQFTITAIDNTGTQVSLATDSITVTAVNPNDMLTLSLVATPDRTEVYEQPGRVRFSIAITNNSNVEAKEVAVLHGTTKIYTFASIPAGETRTLTRDAALSMAGKYQFSASAKDALGNTQTYQGNEMQIAFSVPTPAPETPTPPANPTAEPTFAPMTLPPLRDASVGAIPKVIQTVLTPVLLIAGLLLIGSAVLLIIATKRRAEQKKASEAAYDHLERSKHRDYVTPAEVDEEELTEVQKGRHADSKPTVDSFKNAKRPSGSPITREEIPLDDVELPHMKYVRDAYGQSEAPARGPYRKSSKAYEEDLYGTDEVFTTPSDSKVMYEEAYDDLYEQGTYDQQAYGQDGYADTETDAAYPAEESDAYGQGYAQEYNDVGQAGEYDDYEEPYENEDSDDPNYRDDRLTDPYSETSSDAYEPYDDTAAPPLEVEPPQRPSRPERNARGRDVSY